MQPQGKQYKVVLIGNSKSGKTTLLNRYFGYPDHKSYIETTVIQHRHKLLSHQNIKISLEILDTPGSSEYEVLRQSSYKGCNAILFVFDPCDSCSFYFIEDEIQQIISKDLCSYNSIAFLIGIKKNKAKQNVFPEEDAKMMGNIIGQYIQTDLQFQGNLTEMFTHIVDQIIKFDQEDTKVPSMLEKLYQNSHNPSMQKLRQIFTTKQTFKADSLVKQNKNAAAGQSLPQQNKKNVVKAILIGDPQVGKSSIGLNYVHNIFTQEYEPTIGIDFNGKDQIISGESYKLQIWDTSGISKFQPIIKHYYNESIKIVLFVYDVTNQQSFNKIRTYVQNFNEIVGFGERYMCLVGNKCDLSKKVTTQMGMELAQQLKLHFTQISAKYNKDLQNLFLTSLAHIHNIKKEVNKNK